MKLFDLIMQLFRQIDAQMSDRICKDFQQLTDLELYRAQYQWWEKQWQEDTQQQKEIQWLLQQCGFCNKMEITLFLFDLYYLYRKDRQGVAPFEIRNGSGEQFLL